MKIDLAGRATWIAVALTVFAICLAAGSSHFHTIDEGSMFVTAANVVNRGEFHTNQLGWAQWANRPGEEQGLLSETGDLYSKKSPIVIAFMIPLAALGRMLPSLSMLRATLLLGPIFTTLTAILLYNLSRELGYSRQTGILATLVFALCTMALPYSRLVMGEPVASFGLLLSLRATRRSEQGASLASLVCGAGLAVAIGANSAYLLFVPVFAFALAASRWKLDSLRARIFQLALFALPLIGVGASLAGYNFIRFGSALQTGYHFASGQEGFTTPLWWGAPGLLISPARGFLWYNPPALLALIGWPRFHRLHRALSWLMLVVAVAHVIVFGMWWEWWGGYGWGPRFLLSLIPCVIIACLPTLQSMLDRNGLPRFAIGALLLAGFAVQIAGTAIDFNTYEIDLEGQFPVDKSQPLRYHHDPALVYDVARSPIVVHFQRLTGSPLDFWWMPGAWTPRAIPETISVIQAERRGGDAILYLIPELIDPLVTAADLPPTFGLPVNVRPDDAMANRLFDRALRNADRVWMITWYGAGDPGNWYEAHLRANWASVSERTLDGNRAILFARPPADPAPQAADSTFGPIRLTAYAARADAGTLFVELHWRADEPPTEDYVAFVHIIGSDGTVIVGQDRQPLGSYRRTTTWQPDETITDRFAFPLSTDQLGGARIEVGWYSWPSLQRLPLTNSSGNRVESDSLTINFSR